MTVVIFNSTTNQVVHVQRDVRPSTLPEEIGRSFFEAMGLDSAEYTCRSLDIDLSYNEFIKYKEVTDGVIVDKVATPEEIFNNKQLAIETAIQVLLDTTAKANGNWDSMLSARAAAALPGPFQTQALSLSQWWSDTWAFCYTVLGEVKNGTRPIPSMDELMSELPAYTP